MLTTKQLKLYNYLKKSFKDNSVSPSFEEMKIALGLKSKSGIHRLINALEERGFIKRLHNKARAIKIINQSVNEQKRNEDFYNEFPQTNYNNSKNVKLYGKIAAGTPVEAIENPEGFMSIPSEMIKNNNQHYALKVSGE